MSQFILSIDIGTTSAKALAVQADGVVLSTLQQFYPTTFPYRNYAEQDPDEILSAVEGLVIQTITRLNHNPICIVFSCAMHGLIAVDNQGKTLTNLLIWADNRSKEEAKELRASSLGSELYRHTGTPIHPMSPLCKLLWLKKNQPKLFTQAAKFISIKEYIVYQWTGQYLVDYSIASATGLFDGEKLKWSSRALQHAAISADQLSHPVSPDSNVRLFTTVAKKLNVTEDTPVMLGSSDGCLAQWGSRALSSDEMTITVGTSGAVRVSLPAFKVDESQRTFCYVLKSNVFIAGGAINSGTSIINWFSKEFNNTSLVDIVAQVAHVPAGSEGLIVLPHLLGERAPYYRPDSRGVFFGVTIHHTQLHFQRAILEGICYQLRSVVESVERVYGTPKKILVSGGIIRSTDWLQMLSDVLDKSLIIQDDNDASAMGAAYLAFEAMGNSIQTPTKGSAIIHPNKENRKSYDQSFSIFQRLYQQLEPLFDGQNQ